MMARAGDCGMSPAGRPDGSPDGSPEKPALGHAMPGDTPCEYVPAPLSRSWASHKHESQSVTLPDGKVDD